MLETVREFAGCSRLDAGGRRRDAAGVRRTLGRRTSSAGAGPALFGPRPGRGDRRAEPPRRTTSPTCCAARCATATGDCWRGWSRRLGAALDDHRRARPRLRHGRRRSSACLADWDPPADVLDRGAGGGRAAGDAPRAGCRAGPSTGLRGRLARWGEPRDAVGAGGVARCFVAGRPGDPPAALERLAGRGRATPDRAQTGPACGRALAAENTGDVATRDRGTPGAGSTTGRRRRTWRLAARPAGPAGDVRSATTHEAASYAEARLADAGARCTPTTTPARCASVHRHGAAARRGRRGRASGSSTRSTGSTAARPGSASRMVAARPARAELGAGPRRRRGGAAPATTRPLGQRRGSPGWATARLSRGCCSPRPASLVAHVLHGSRRRRAARPSSCATCSTEHRRVVDRGPALPGLPAHRGAALLAVGAWALRFGTEPSRTPTAYACW